MEKSRSIDFAHLSALERIQLAQELWDSLAPEEADLPLTDEQRAELRRRMEEARRNPSAVYSWEEVEAQAMEAIRAVRARTA